MKSRLVLVPVLIASFAPPLRTADQWRRYGKYEFPKEEPFVAWLRQARSLPFTLIMNIRLLTGGGVGRNGVRRRYTGVPGCGTPGTIGVPDPRGPGTGRRPSRAGRFSSEGGPGMTPAKNIYSRLGVKTLINAQGTVTVVGGSLMPPEVVQAMAEAAGWFVSIPELQEKVGARIAGLLGVPAAMVTAGAASAIAVATAACMARDDHPESIDRLPETDGLRNEVILQKGHGAATSPDGPDRREARLGGDPRGAGPGDQPPHRDDVLPQPLRAARARSSARSGFEVGKDRGVPTFLDAAADVPPISRFSEYIREGFDLVTFSGGKAIRGPQASGLLLGRADLIAAGRRAISPSMGIGRGMKVGKEEIVGLLAAVERFVEARPRRGMAHLGGPDVAHHRRARPRSPASPRGGRSPRSPTSPPGRRRVEPMARRARRPRRSSASLWDGDPRIAILAEGPHGLRIMVWTLRDDEHLIVARRVREVLEGR